MCRTEAGWTAHGQANCTANSLIQRLAHILLKPDSCRHGTHVQAFSIRFSTQQRTIIPVVIAAQSISIL